MFMVLLPRFQDAVRREALLRRAGTVTNAGACNGPGSAADRSAKSYALRCVRGTGAPPAATASISQRAAVLAGFGAARQRALVPVDPDRLGTAERRDDT